MTLALAIAGCGPSVSPGPASSAPTPPPVKTVKVTNPEVTLVSTDDKGIVHETIVKSPESTINMGTGGPEYGELEDVTGEIRKGGVTECQFEGPHASVDREKKTLVLDGGVKVTAVQREDNPDGKETSVTIVMRSQRLRYDQNLKRIEAEGNVTVTSQGMTLGPLPKLWAKPDLSKIATPGKFQ